MNVGLGGSFGCGHLAPSRLLLQINHSLFSLSPLVFRASFLSTSVQDERHESAVTENIRKAEDKAGQQGGMPNSYACAPWTHNSVGVLRLRSEKPYLVIGPFRRLSMPRLLFESP